MFDKWIFGEGQSGRWYLIHTRSPRFIAEVIDPEEGPVDHLIDDDRALAIDWIDHCPSGDRLALLTEAVSVVIAFDDQYDDDATEGMAQARRESRRPSDN